MKKIILLLCAGVSVAVSSVKAQTTGLQEDLRYRTTAVPFLRISPDARAAGMGEAGIAGRPDANSPFWNLAKTTFTTSQTGLSLNYTPWLKDIGLNDVYLASLSGYHKLADGVSAVGGSLRYFSLGNITFTDYSGNTLNTFKPQEFALDFGYSRKLGERLSLGVALKYINSKLASGNIGGVDFKSGNAVAGDVSLYYDGTTQTNYGGFAWGITLSNLGSKIGYTNDDLNKDYLPANLGLGAQYTHAVDDVNRLTFTLDVNKLLVPAIPSLSGNNTSEDSAAMAQYRSQSVLSSYMKSFNDGTNIIKSFQASVGAEYCFNDQFFARAGYFYEGLSEGNRKYVTVGAGIKFNTMTFNLSYLVPSGQGVSRNPLSNTIRFGINFDLNPEEATQY